MPKMIKTGYTTSCSYGRFNLPAELIEKLGLSAGQKFLFKIIENGNSEYPFIVKYEHIDEGGVTDDVDRFERCTLCGFTTKAAHRLNGKVICFDCAEKLGGMADARTETRTE